MGWIDDEGRYHRDDRRPTTPTYQRPVTPPSPRQTIRRNEPPPPPSYVGSIVSGILVGLSVIGGIIFLGINKIVQFPNTILWDYGFIYWFAMVLTIIIPTIVLMVKEDFYNGVLTFLATSVANITAFYGAYLTSALIMPAIYSIPDGDVATIIRGILSYSPQIIIGTVLLSSFIFIIVRYNENYEIKSIDILWSFLCTIITPIALLLAIGLIIGVIALVIAIIYAVISIIAVIIAIACFCGS